MGVKKGAKPIRWTKREIQTLKRSIAKLTNREIAQKLGRSYCAVTLQLHKHGIVRTKAVRRRHAKNLFAKDHSPWNRGLKGIHLSRNTEFKKGNKSWNRKPDGHISIIYHKGSKTYYKFITVPRGRNVLLHRWRWEQKHGPIPPRHIVGFKNGKTLDCRMCNLYLMSKADNARRNRNEEKTIAGIKRAWKEGRFHDSDKWIAFTLGMRDKELQNMAMNAPELIALQRMKLKLRRAIRDEKHGEVAKT